jgi:hypothetical protein
MSDHTIDAYKKRFAAQIAEANSQGNFDTPKIIGNALRLSRVATPGEFAAFKEAFKDYDHGLGSWKKWGGGNKMGSGGAAVNAARKARAEARRSAPDANVNNYVNKNLFDRIGLTPVSNFLDSRLNDVQGKFMPSNPSFGFSQKTLNEAGARGADSRFAGDIGASVYGVSPANSFSDASSFGFSGDLGYGSPVNSFTDAPSFNFTGDLGYSPTFGFTDGLGAPSLSNLSSFDPGSFLGAMAMNQGPSTPVRQYDGKFLPYFGGGRNGPIRMKQASDPRFAMSIFA